MHKGAGRLAAQVPGATARIEQCVEVVLAAQSSVHLEMRYKLTAMSGNATVIEQVRGFDAAGCGGGLVFNYIGPNQTAPLPNGWNRAARVSAVAATESLLVTIAAVSNAGAIDMLVDDVAVGVASGQSPESSDTFGSGFEF